MGQPRVKILAVDQTKRESYPKFPTYNANVQSWDSGRRREEQP